MTTQTERLKELRLKRGMTQKHVADTLHIDQATYCLYENGKRRISCETVVKIASFFGVTTGYLMGEECLEQHRTFAETLAALRTDRGLSQDALAKDLEISKNSIYYYENDKRVPDIDTAVRIAQYFGVTVDYLLGYNKPQNSDECTVRITADVRDDARRLAEQMGISVDELVNRLLIVTLLGKVMQ